MTEVLKGGREAKKIDDDKHTTGKTDKKSYYTAAPTLSSINNKVFLIEFLIFSIFSDLIRSHHCLVTWEVASKYMFGTVSMLKPREEL